MRIFSISDMIHCASYENTVRSGLVARKQSLLKLSENSFLGQVFSSFCLKSSGNTTVDGCIL